VKEDSVWGKQIDGSISASLKNHIIDTMDLNVIEINKPSDAVDSKIPLSEHLRKVINTNIRSNLQQFINALAREAFPGCSL
jgi:hypothetical protein